MTWPIGPNLAPGWIAATIKEEGQTRGCDRSQFQKKIKQVLHHIPTFQYQYQISFIKGTPPYPFLKLFAIASTGFTLYWCSGAHHFKVGGTVTAMAIHPLEPQYGRYMPYPIYGNSAISIIIGQIGHFIFSGLLWSFH
ncbi:hypothetical protein O181_034338 [Austropuccinia psidii MF-1]|uniref:Uncharacterized protein n=1 Tax=Austropuccinia psidii MF-1 TaxID=1389203 RepID=A0A9Q3D598_9BASI|nr:hypothetical protein [Austropuccinia psidii MF-1]